MPDLYYIPGGPPSRAVLLLVQALKLEVNLKFVNLEKGEHMTPEFLKLNPQHTVPVLVDDDLVICESRAIMTYLCDQNVGNDFLYPKDPRKRALVDQRLYFDNGVLYARFVDYYFPPIFEGVPYDQSKMARIKEAFTFLDTFLERSKYVSGNDISTVTVADLAILVSVCTYEANNFDISPYKNVNRWMQDLKMYKDLDHEQNLKFKVWYETMTKRKI